MHSDSSFENASVLEVEYPSEPVFIRTIVENDKVRTVRLVASASLPTRFGNFTLFGFHDSAGDKEHTAIVHGEANLAKDVALRVHSECHTGDVLGSLRCDCRDQLEAALRYINEQVCGVVLYLRQEGRGIGLLNKIKAYKLQDAGFDTVDANLRLGLPAEARDYFAASAMIEILGIQSIRLMTNNPAKMEALTKLGVKVNGRIPLVIPGNAYNSRYLLTKKARMNHLY